LDWQMDKKNQHQGKSIEFNLPHLILYYPSHYMI